MPTLPHAVVIAKFNGKQRMATFAGDSVILTTMETERILL